MVGMEPGLGCRDGCADEEVGPGGQLLAQHFGRQVFAQMRDRCWCGGSVRGGSVRRLPRPFFAVVSVAAQAWRRPQVPPPEVASRAGRPVSGVSRCCRGGGGGRCPGLPGERNDVDGGCTDVVGRFLGNFRHDDGDVVRSAGFEGEVHEGFHAFAEVLRFPDGSLHDVAGHVVQAVGAEQPAFAGLHLQGGEVQFRACVNIAEDAHEDVLVRVGFGFFGAQAAFVDQPLDKRVVHADLFKFSVAQAVGAGVADVCEVKLAFGQQQGRDGRAHAGKLGIDVDEFGEQGIGGLDFVGQDGAGIAVVFVRVQVDHVQNRGGRGNIAAGVPAHAIGHDGQVLAHVCGVVILGTDAADVRPGGIAQDERPLRGWCLLRGNVRSGHGYGLNSMTVLPILTGTPRSTGRARVSCWSARYVPLVEPRSSMNHRLPCGKSRACLPEA